MSEIHIRKASATDAAAIATIFNDYIALSYYTLEQTEWTERSARKTLETQSDRELFLVAVSNDEVKAFARARKYSDRFGYRNTCTTSLFVAPDETGQGIGGELIKQLYESCQRLGYRHLCAKIIARNEDSISFHRRFGYELVGIQKQAGIVNGEYVDVALMQKLLEN